MKSPENMDINVSDMSEFEEEFTGTHAGTLYEGHAIDIMGESAEADPAESDNLLMTKTLHNLDGNDMTCTLHNLDGDDMSRTLHGLDGDVISAV